VIFHQINVPKHIRYPCCHLPAEIQRRTAALS